MKAIFVRSMNENWLISYTNPFCDISLSILLLWSKEEKNEDLLTFHSKKEA